MKGREEGSREGWPVSREKQRAAHRIYRRVEGKWFLLGTPDEISLGLRSWISTTSRLSDNMRANCSTTDLIALEVPTSG